MSRLNGNRGWLSLTEQQLRDGAYEHLELGQFTIYMRWSSVTKSFLVNAYKNGSAWRSEAFYTFVEAWEACVLIERAAAIENATDALGVSS